MIVENYPSKSLTPEPYSVHKMGDISLDIGRGPRGKKKKNDAKGWNRTSFFVFPKPVGGVRL
jgi:hypothetical protein